jgi:hypothetical protein
MDFDHLYVISDASKQGTLYLFSREEHYPLDLLYGVDIPSQPIIFDYFKGSKLRDVLPTGYGYLLLFSARIISLLSKNNITGWKTFPVEVFSKERKHIEGYYGFTVSGRCGPKNNSKSKKIMMPPRVPSGPSYETLQGIFFDPLTWDGNDIFIIEDTAIIVVLEKVKILLESNDITNIKFIPLIEYENMSS